MATIQATVQRAITDARSRNVNDLFLVGGCAALSVSLSLVYNRHNVPLGSDAEGYLWMAQGGDVKGLWPPFYPFLGSIALRLGFDSLNIVSLISLILLIVLIWRISNELELGTVPVLLVALCPTIFAYGWAGMSEMLFTVLMIAAIWTFIHTETGKQGIAAGVFTILAYETRYIGEFLVLWMIVMLIWNRNRWKFLALGISVIGIVSSMAINLWKYGMLAGERPESHTAFISTVKSLGLAVWAVWLGDGTMIRLAYWPLAIAGLIALGWILWKRSPYSLAIACYLGLLIVAELFVPLNPPDRRYLLPVVPLIIIVSYERLKRFAVPLIIVAGVIAIVHASRGALA